MCPGCIALMHPNDTQMTILFMQRWQESECGLAFFLKIVMHGISVMVDIMAQNELA